MFYKCWSLGNLRFFVVRNYHIGELFGMRNKCGRFYFPKIKLEGGGEGRGRRMAEEGGGGGGGGGGEGGEGGRRAEGRGEVTMRDQAGRDVDARD